ncbi:helix-turn-helix domain-containing protein [Mammaliicoccus sciuri]|uniref:helix-turn-helix domain-containing protein n=1 Tax=Mammaliicoccus sciuri TaxID=1296 RepID=UPI0021D3B74F|nr:helix-turn-helix domain-containing protein [Mammaliicoccus sciuri]UXV29995.1 helix-turn-helix domain-containing protein [Mammaliicoccus sciuri]
MMSDEIKTDITGYGLVFKSVLKRNDVDAEAKALYAYLSSYAGLDTKAFPGVSLICHDLNISEKRFQKYRKQLENAGVITINRKRTDNGFSKNIYTINHKSVPSHFVPVENLPVENLPVGNDVTKNNSIKNNSIKNNSIKNNSIKNNSIKNNNFKNNSATNVASELETQLTREFEYWYNLYDKKKDRKSALTKYKSARKKHSYEVIVKGTKEYLKTITDKQYQKYPKTFLHNESYLDDYSNDIKKDNDINPSNEVMFEELL